MASLRHETWIDAPPERVHALLATGAAIGTWWDAQTEVQTPDGLVLEHTPGPEHGTVRFLVLESTPRRIAWRVISEHPADTPASAWTGTTISFDLLPRAEGRVANEAWARAVPVQCVLRFEHAGWDADSRYFAFCNTAWAEVLQMLANKAQEA